MITSFCVQLVQKLQPAPWPIDLHTVGRLDQTFQQFETKMFDEANENTNFGR